MGYIGEARFFQKRMLPEKRVSVVLPGPLHRDLKLHAFEHQMTMNDVLLKALRSYLQLDKQAGDWKRS